MSECSREIAGWHRYYETGVVFLQGHDAEFTFMVKHRLVWETSGGTAFFSWSFDKTFKRWKESHQTPPSTMLTALLAVEGNASGRVLVAHQRWDPRSYSGRNKRHYLEQQSIAGRQIGGGSIQAKSQQPGDCDQHPTIPRAKAAHRAGPFREDSGQKQPPWR